MLREIKFRAWVTYYEYECPPRIEDVTMIDWEKKTAWVRSLDGEDLTEVDFSMIKLLQLTDYKDKDDVQIYEGYILDVANGSINGTVVHDIIEVKFLEGRFTLPYFCWKEDGSDNSDRTHHCKVIGNIFEHKHLLEEGGYLADSDGNKIVFCPVCEESLRHHKHPFGYQCCDKCGSTDVFGERSLVDGKTKTVKCNHCGNVMPNILEVDNA
jgi:hypothetical protein